VSLQETADALLLAFTVPGRPDHQRRGTERMRSTSWSTVKRHRPVQPVGNGRCEPGRQRRRRAQVLADDALELVDELDLAFHQPRTALDGSACGLGLRTCLAW
jgi:hypothetical protein